MLGDNVAYHFGPQRFPDVGIAEEAGHMNQNVLEERFHLGRVLPKELEVLVKIVDLLKDHPAGDAPADGRGLVLLEVHARGLPQQVADLVALIGSGKVYVNVGTSTHTNGALRGQVR